MTNHFLLLGAGFSRNWGGWLADEVFEYLLARHYSHGVRHTLISNRGSGFEAALAVLQKNWRQSGSVQARADLREMEDALATMFTDMNNGLLSRKFEMQEDWHLSIRRFLTKFDAIFTLNQDLLLEQHYMTFGVQERVPDLWQRVHLPGIQLPPSEGPNDIVYIRAMQPRDDLDLGLRPDFQPIYKLHGSSNWKTSDGSLMVMGADKANMISQFPLLTKYHAKFAEALSSPDARLMVIGYSFGDAHINSVIERACIKDRLAVFIIDPNGLEVLNPWRGAHIPGPKPLLEAVLAHSVGASRRRMAEIFGDDAVEFKKVSQFFQ